MDSAQPRLLLVSPPLDRADAAAKLEGVLAAAGAADVAALLLRAGSLGDEAFARALAAPLAAAQAAGIAVLLEGRPALVAPCGADGLHLDLTAKGPRLKDLRQQLGEGVILGAGCGDSRHLAMTAGEAGADYVAFGDIEGLPADPELLAWWQALMTPPQVAFGAADLETAGRLAAAGADFVAAAPGLWTAGDPAGALAALQQVMAPPA